MTIASAGESAGEGRAFSHGASGDVREVRTVRCRHRREKSLIAPRGCEKLWIIYGFGYSMDIWILYGYMDIVWIYGYYMDIYDIYDVYDCICMAFIYGHLWLYTAVPLFLLEQNLQIIILCVYVPVPPKVRGHLHPVYLIIRNYKTHILIRFGTKH